MSIGHGEGALAGLDIEGQGAELLDRIDAEQYTALPTAMAEALQVQAQAAGVLHGADRQQPGARAAGVEQVGFRIAAMQVDLDYVDSLRLERLPYHTVGEI